MKSKLFIFCFVFFLNANAQFKTEKIETNQTKTGLTEEELNYACIEYKKMMQTETYILNENNARSFAEKVNGAIDFRSVSKNLIKDKESYLKLIESNISKTKFKSIEEMRDAFEKQEASTKKLMEENKKFYELLEKTSDEQRFKIFKPLYEHSRKAMFNN